MKLVSRSSSKDNKQRYKINTKSKQPLADESSLGWHLADEQQNLQQKRKSSASKVLVTLLVILVVAAAGFGGWYYWWTTYATFDYHVRPIVILEGETVGANDFLSIYTDTTLVSADFLSHEFNAVEGRQNVPLLLTRGWRSLETTASLYVLTTINSISHEFATPGQELYALDFVANADVASGVNFDVGFSHETLPLEEYAVGEHILHLYLNHAGFNVILTVTDTTPPTAVAVNHDIRIGEDVTPEDFVVDIFDASPIASIAFVVEPDVFARQNQNVEVVIEDIFGNYATFSSTLYIELNQAPPTIEGTDTLITMVGTPILYLTNVTAYDDFGRELEVNVDSSNVDQHTVGIYYALYYVYDFSGHRTEIEIEVHVIDIDIDYVHERVDAALSQILSDGMTQLEQVKAIHLWVRHNVSHASVRGGPETAYEGAYIALRNRRGNCFIFYSISEVMLTRAGIPNMRIERIPGTRTTHRWNLINPDNLGWHHFDTFPTRLGQGPHMALFTSSQAADFTRRIRAINNMQNYYTYDPELYPEIVWD
ncbi:MAG: transglutaminase-like domain-containing protein [Oscillospiraceae bacterium]|nr:transglutaminase-like domain-containing protein [Oscillospiraceae bacterium]